MPDQEQITADSQYLPDIYHMVECTVSAETAVMIGTGWVTFGMRSRLADAEEMMKESSEKDPSAEWRIVEYHRGKVIKNA